MNEFTGTFKRLLEEDRRTDIANLLDWAREDCQVYAPGGPKVPYLRGVSLPNASLEGLDLSHFDLTGADLSGANLRKTRFSDGVLDDANLTEADLAGASFLKATCHRVRLDQAVLPKGGQRWAELAEGLETASGLSVEWKLAWLGRRHRSLAIHTEVQRMYNRRLIGDLTTDLNNLQRKVGRYFVLTSGAILCGFLFQAIILLLVVFRTM